MAAEFRQIHVAIWRDEWFLDLEPQEKLLFIYLFSNGSSNLAGIYRLSIKHLELETGLKPAEYATIIRKFENDGKVIYLDGYIWIKNLRKYNESRSPSTKLAIDAIISRIPDCEIKRLYWQYYYPNTAYPHPVDTLLTHPLHPVDREVTEQSITKQSIAEQQNPQTDGQAFDNLGRCFEDKTGYPITPNQENIATLNAWVKDGIIETDIEDAISFYSGNGKTARSPAQIDRSVRTAHAKRIQADAKSSTPVIDPRSLASEVYE